MDTQEDHETLGKIGYLKRLELYGTEKPYQITVRPKYVQDSDAQKTNIVIDPQVVKITDIINRRGEFSTDIQGFELATFPSSLSSDELQDLDEIESRYYAEAKEFLMRRYNAHRVLIFDTTIRRSKPGRNTDTTLLKNQQILGPSIDCHVDQSPNSVRKRVRKNFPNDADQLLAQRVQVVKSTRPGDYTPADLVSSVWEGETLQIYHNPNHEWWFASKMEADDVLLIKMFDSEGEREGNETAMCEYLLEFFFSMSQVHLIALSTGKTPLRDRMGERAWKSEQLYFLNSRKLETFNFG
ncbi:methyltransferase CmcJ [Colletotrichum abscissum]|uniref:Methyltransferase CmcJ n=1 Tax=Colletotrichum abscissum TaxID=1671311 RepID=A0A9Q0B8Z2_9PEZI|nr:methyltransferase CmcJ [Colletotrichum abscissum]